MSSNSMNSLSISVKDGVPFSSSSALSVTSCIPETGKPVRYRVEYIRGVRGVDSRLPTRGSPNTPPELSPPRPLPQGARGVFEGGKPHMLPTWDPMWSLA